MWCLKIKKGKYGMFVARVRLTANPVINFSLQGCYGFLQLYQMLDGLEEAI